MHPKLLYEGVDSPYVTNFKVFLLCGLPALIPTSGPKGWYSRIKMDLYFSVKV